MSTIEQEAIVADLQRKLAERDAELRSALHEISCCDDVTLGVPLAQSIGELQRHRERAEIERNGYRHALAAWKAKAEAAERAKEEFRLLASLRLFHAPTIGYCWFERCGVSWTGKAHATINEANAEKTAAFLAASGGK